MNKIWQILLVSPERFGKDLTLQCINIYRVLLQQEKNNLHTLTLNKLTAVQHKQEVTSSMYSRRSKAFLKSYSLARLFSSQI